MINVNDAGLGHCPICGDWKELTRYHPKDAGIPRNKKKKYCDRCITNLKNEREPFYRIKKAISNHKVLFGYGDYSFKEIMVLHKHQGGQCAYCAGNIPYEFSLDHVIPKKFGGKNLLINILLVCLTCNSAKQHLEPFFFVRRKRYKLKERIIQKMKGAYDYHDYHCDAKCKDCRGEQNANERLCATCTIRQPAQAGSEGGAA